MQTVAIKETISVMKQWNDKTDKDKEYWEYDFMEDIDYKLSAVQSEDYCGMYQSKQYTQYTNFQIGLLFQFLSWVSTRHIFYLFLIHELNLNTTITMHLDMIGIQALIFNYIIVYFATL